MLWKGPSCARPASTWAGGGCAAGGQEPLEAGLPGDALPRAPRWPRISGLPSWCTLPMVDHPEVRSLLIEASSCWPTTTRRPSSRRSWPAPAHGERWVPRCGASASRAPETEALPATMDTSQEPGALSGASSDLRRGKGVVRPSHLHLCGWSASGNLGPGALKLRLPPARAGVRIPRLTGPGRPLLGSPLDSPLLPAEYGAPGRTDHRTWSPGPEQASGEAPFPLSKQGPERK